MELASFVALRLTAIILSFSSAELAEVFSRLWHDVLVQFHLNPTQLLPYQLTSVNLAEAQDNHADNGDRLPRTKPKRDA